MNILKKTNLILLNWVLNLPEIEKEEDKKIDFAVGGQAVIEGVMMRSPSAITIAVRKLKGDITIKKDLYRTLTQKFKALNLIIVRGVINLFEMMVIGTKAINYSANESLEEESYEEEKKKKTRGQKILEGVVLVFSMIIALCFSLFLFKFVPLWITTYLDSNIKFINDHYLVFNIIDGGIKATLFLSYIYLLSLVPSFRRVFQYHGAEHKSIYTYEKKLDLNVKNAKKQSRFHPRCGTSFIIIVFVISIIFYTLLPKQETFLNNFLIRATFLPLVAGISYEALKLSAKYSESRIIKLFIAPGLAFQRLTTKEPTDLQLEVGLNSLKAALEMENK